MVTRDDILCEGQRWLGTPFRWKQACRGRGCDCKGLLVGIARALGMPEAETMAARIVTYSKSFQSEQLLEGLRETLVPVQTPQPADIVCMPVGRSTVPRHLGMLTKRGWLLHTYGGGVGRVVEVPLVRSRVHSYWTWPSLCEGGTDGRPI